MLKMLVNSNHLPHLPRYRAILYERNFYDIFFLDLGGNCIYSVYKAA